MIWGKPKEFYEINYQGTLNVIQACHDAQVPRLIYTSSPSVVFDGESQQHVNEDTPYPSKWLAEYPRTKALAEQAVMASDGERGLSTVSIRPHLIWGPGDHHLIPRLIEVK